jgi:nickel/cobalt transporter (NiCoT) family protein
MTSSQLPAPTAAPRRGRHLAPYAVCITALHLSGACALALTVRTHPTLASMGLVAYSLGLRHAFDADHLAAIDNSVRRLIERERDPTGVGFFFSLGHSTVVFVMALATALTAREARAHLPLLERFGHRFGPTFSGLFLLGLGALNARTWLSLRRQQRRVALGLPVGALDDTPAGPLWRLLAPLTRATDRAWRLYPVGLLFGLGFDTATEVSLLAMSSGAASRGMPWFGVLSLPLLFAAAMSLVDTLDGALMADVYRAARDDVSRRLRYNLVVTGLSVVAALGIGGVEVVQVLANTTTSDALALRWARGLDLGLAGYALVLAFAAVWGAWALRARFKIEGRARA